MKAPLQPVEYAKAFLLNFIFYAAAIAVYMIYAAGRPGGVSWGIVALLVIGSVVLTAMRLRRLQPVERRLRFKNRQAFLSALDHMMKLKDRWTLAEDSGSFLRYTARFNVGLYMVNASLEVMLANDEALLVGPPRIMSTIVPLLVQAGVATQLT